MRERGIMSVRCWPLETISRGEDVGFLCKANSIREFVPVGEKAATCLGQGA